MTTDTAINSAQHEQIENLYTLMEMAAANLSVLMAVGQETRFLVEHETVINSP